MNEKWRDEFENPGSEWRGAPFWSWNGRLDPEELRRQVRDMKEHGMGGFFMHSRSGLQTPYLGREWMECIKATVDEAKKVGMLAWLYDEDRWPSGAAGGLVTELHPEYAGKALLMKTLGRDEYMPDAHTLWAFTAKMKGGVLSGVKPLAPDAPSIPAGTVALLFSMVTDKPSAWYNGGAYADLLDPEAVRRFLDVTIEPYRHEVGDEFGKVVPGIFTDEPNFGRGPVAGAGPTASWTGRLPEVFRERYGYEITSRLPELFHDVAGVDSHKLRRDYHDCRAHMFVEAFSRPYGIRCETLGFAYTGHYLEEQTLASQTAQVGSVMRHYEHMQAPGIDILTISTGEVLTCKQVSSVARQTGKKRVLSELYGTSGWDFTFADEKWVGDWQIALGVNLRCQHLTWYTMARGGKRDYPPTFNYQSTSWKHHRPTEDYFARMCYMTTLGEAQRDVLVLSPVESYWATCKALANTGDAELDQSLRRVMMALLEGHHDFDLGDEDLLARLAAVEGNSLRVGSALYRALVVPPAVTWRRSTMDMVERLLDAGGTVVAVPPVADRVECEPDGRMAELRSRHGAATVEAGCESLAAALDAAGVRSVSVADARKGGEIAPVLVQRRSFEGRTLLLLVNTDRENGYEAEVAVSGACGGVEDWDLWSGATRPIRSHSERDRIRFNVKLAPTGSRMLVIGPDLAAAVPPEPELKGAGRIRLGRRWKFERDDMNSRILDKCRWRFDNEPLSAETPIWLVEREARARTGLEPNGNGDRQPWKMFRNVTDTGRTIELRYGFKARVRPAGAVWLVMERAGDFQIELNGKPVPARPKGWWIDRAFDRIDLKGRVKKGVNELVLKTRMKTDTALEQAYLAGEFGVEARTLDLIAEPGELRTGDWVKQGYAQYSGSMSMRQEVKIDRRRDERLFLVFGARSVAATCLAVKVNGKSAGLIPWPPYELEITDLVKTGRNLVEVEVVGSRRNLLGPLHIKEVKPWWHGPGELAPDAGRYVPEYHLVPYGITGDVSIERRVEAGGLPARKAGRSAVGRRGAGSRGRRA